MLKKVALCASVLTLSALAGGSGALAYDAPSNSFYPAAGWDVSKQASAANAGQHCLMLAEYNNGFFIQFQGKDSILEVISLDLRQPVFEAGQSVPVTLTVPGKSTIKLSGSAYNKEVLTLDMSGQDRILETLRSASALDIDIDGNAFRFFLTGFANALKDFDRCNEPAPDMAALVVEDERALEEDVAQEDLAAAPTPETSTEEAVTQEDLETETEAEEETTPKIATGEPLRDAPSENMKRRQEKEKEKYDAEIARIMPREDSVTADLQRQMEESGQTLSDVGDMSAPPQRSASRFTEQLAQEMGTAVESRAPVKPVRSISAEKMEQEKNAQDTEPAQDLTASLPEDREVESSEVIDLTAVEQDSSVETDMEQTAAVVSEPEDHNAKAMPGDDEKGESLMEDLKDFVESEPEDIPPAQIVTPPSAPETDLADNPVEDTKPEEEEEVIATAPQEAEADMTPPPTASEPKTERVASTPEMKVTKNVMSAQADFTDMPVDTVPAVPPAMKERRVSELEAKLAMLKRENEALNAELEMVLQSSEQERLDIASDNWNLEQATMRYNEAERQIMNLGQQIQKERAQCAVEKKELEMMLFDPQLTEEAQLGYLAKLEDELDAAQAEIQSLQAQIGN